MPFPDTSDDELRAPNGVAAPTPATNEEATLNTDTNPVLNVSTLSNTPTATDPTPVAVANPSSNTKGVVAVLHDLGFTLSPRRPVDEQTGLLRIGSLRQLAAFFRTSMPDQTKEAIQLGKYDIKGLHARGVIAQEDLEFLFAPTLIAQPDVRDSGPPTTQLPGLRRQWLPCLRRPSCANKSVPCNATSRRCRNQPVSFPNFLRPWSAPRR